MGPTPDQLEAEIEQTREDLAATVEEISHKVAEIKESVRPANVVRRPKVQQGIAGAVGALAVLLALKTWRRRRHATKHLT
ncbi:MAG TPA: DUF3618 domain-containing protein [Mycobacteriales bacterium]|nr:DUF3618 domain-containing protein [Mycobacteriales bacterium]